MTSLQAAAAMGIGAPVSELIPNLATRTKQDDMLAAKVSAKLSAKKDKRNAEKQGSEAGGWKEISPKKDSPKKGSPEVYEATAINLENRFDALSDDEDEATGEKQTSNDDSKANGFQIGTQSKNNQGQNKKDTKKKEARTTKTPARKHPSKRPRTS
jgi:hypothetical protein